MSIRNVKIRFINVINTQTDDVAIDSPLGPVLADVFVGYYEAKVLQNIQKPFSYFYIRR